MAEIRTPDQQSLVRRFDSLDPQRLPRLRLGFSVLSSMPQVKLEAAAEFMLDRRITSQTYTVREAIDELGLSESTGGDVTAALSFILSIYAVLDVSAEDFVQFAPPELVSPEDHETAKVIAKMCLARKGELAEGREVALLATSVLPIYRGIDIETDLRVAFDDDGAVLRSVPVAVAHIRTDNGNDTFFIQLGLKEIGYLITELQNTKRNMSELSKMSLDRG